MQGDMLIPAMAVFMMVVGIAFIYIIVRGNERPLPADGLQWAGAILSGLLIVFSGLLFALSLMDPPSRATGVNANPASLVAMGEPVENFDFKLVNDGTTQSLSDFEGDVILLNIWATWCPPCLGEIPELNRLYQSYQSAGLTVVTISDEPRELLQEFQLDVPLQTVNGYVERYEDLPEQLRRPITGRPTTYIIDRDGYIRGYIEGAGDFAYFEQRILPFLNDTVALK